MKANSYGFAYSYQPLCGTGNHTDLERSDTLSSESSVLPNELFQRSFGPLSIMFKEPQPRGGGHGAWLLVPLSTQSCARLPPPSRPVPSPVPRPSSQEQAVVSVDHAVCSCSLLFRFNQGRVGGLFSLIFGTHGQGAWASDVTMLFCLEWKWLEGHWTPLDQKREDSACSEWESRAREDGEGASNDRTRTATEAKIKPGIPELSSPQQHGFPLGSQGHLGSHSHNLS